MYHSTNSSAAVNTKGAASYLGLAESTLEKARVSGTGPKYLKLGRAVRYRIADLDSWMSDRMVGSTSEAA